MTLPAELRAEAERHVSTATITTAPAREWKADAMSAYPVHSPETRALLHRAADALEWLEGAERTIITKQREGSNPWRDDWAAFDETPGYIISDPVAVAAIDAALTLPATPEGDNNSTNDEERV